MTSEQVKVYLENRGSMCPFCGSSTLVGDDVTIENGTARQEVSCECGEEWVDVYGLVGVEVKS